MVEITYDTNKISFEELLNVFWKNIDPFDAAGQFCDKGYSYKSAAFYINDNQKKLIEKSIKAIENDFNNKVVTFVKKFEKFYPAEDYHQNYYQTNFINYLLYKKAVSYTHLRAHETLRHLVCRLLLEKKKKLS